MKPSVQSSPDESEIIFTFFITPVFNFPASTCSGSGSPVAISTNVYFFHSVYKCFLYLPAAVFDVRRGRRGKRGKKFLFGIQVRGFSVSGSFSVFGHLCFDSLFF